MSHIETLLQQIEVELDLDRETEQEVLAEIRAHLEETVAEAVAAGLSQDDAIAQAAARFGPGQEIGQALQATHVGWGTAEAVVAAGLPVLLALGLRWLFFAPDGTAIGWEQVLVRPAVWVVALSALLIPLFKFHRWRYALASWGFFWLMTLLTSWLPALRW